MHIYYPFESPSVFPPNNVFDLADSTTGSQKLWTFFCHHIHFRICICIYLFTSEPSSLDYEVTKVSSCFSVCVSVCENNER